jgi:hypothetical protein
MEGQAMSGVVRRRRRRWPGTWSQAAWLKLKRAYGGEKAAAQGFLRIATDDWSCNFTEGLKLLQGNTDD